MTSLPLAPSAPGTPIACTLGRGEYAERTAWIGALNRAALRAYRVHGRTLVLDYAPDADGDIRTLVAQERECCAFLSFTVEERLTEIRLTIAAPDGAENACAVLFAPFLVGTTERLSPVADGSAAPDAPDALLQRAKPRGHRETASIGARHIALAAVACGVCCAAPFALSAVAMATGGGLLAALGRSSTWTVVIAVGAAATAWLWVTWQAMHARRRPARATLGVMSLATALLVAALVWRYL